MDYASDANGSLTAERAYGDNGVYTATLIVVDGEDGAGWDTPVVTVSNVAVSLVAFPDLETGLGEVITVTGVITDSGYLDTHTVSVVWAAEDTGVLNLEAGGLQFSVAHTYTQPGDYSV